MLKKFIVSSFQTNCYLLVNDKKEGILIDPGDNGKKINRYLIENEIHLCSIMLTHGHIDHIGAVDYLYAIYKCPIYTHHETIEMLKDPKLNLSNVFGEPVVINAPITSAELFFNVAGYEIEWLFLPGHCQGSSMIRIVNENIIFSGDVLFKGSIGRFDFPSSSKSDTKNSLDFIKKIDYDCLVYPGHGDSTSIRFEQVNNYYLRS